MQLPAGAMTCLLALSLLSGACSAQSVIVADAASARRDALLAARKAPIESRVPLTDAELAIAQRVQAGRLPCELGQLVELLADPQANGYFRLVIGKLSYRVSPQETTTGAIRLEDKIAGIVWLQLANKSMLMDQKQGRRLADECKSPEQVRIAQEMLVNPPPSVLDEPAVVAPPMPVID